MSEQWIAVLVTAGCISLLVGWVPCMDWLMGYRPRAGQRRQFQRTPREQYMVTDEEVRQLLRRKPFLPDTDKLPAAGAMPHPVTFAPSEARPQPSIGNSL